MKYQKIIIVMTVLISILSTGCTARCRFVTPHVDKGKISASDFCEGYIRACAPAPSAVEAHAANHECRDRLVVFCGGQEVYHGPYTATLLGDKIKYSSITDSSHPNALTIISELPSPSRTLTTAWEKDSGQHREGYCEWKFDPAALEQYKMLQ